MSDLIRAHIIKLHAEGLTQRAIAERVGRAQSSVNAILKDAASKGELGFSPVLPGFGLKQTATRKLDENGDLAWVKQRPVGEEFKLPEGHKHTGGAALVDPENRIINHWVKYGEDKSNGERLTKDDFLEVFSEIRGKAPQSLGITAGDANLRTVYPIADLHIGMQAWGRETGTPWDLKIARETVMSTLTELVDQAPPAAVGVLLDLGDYTHNNSQDNVTPGHKHQLDVDGRFPKIGKEALRLRRDMVGVMLRKHERVIMRGLPGNHDPEVAQMLTSAFALFYENEPRLEVDDDPSDFWFHEFGVNMFAANHGHRTKPDTLPGIMAAYRPEMWGRTKVRQAWSGHIHQTKAGEALGARWETLRTVAARDAYAHQHGYRSGRELTAWTYHETRGLRHRQVVEVL